MACLESQLIISRIVLNLPFPSAYVLQVILEFYCFSLTKAWHKYHMQIYLLNFFNEKGTEALKI